MVYVCVFGGKVIYSGTESDCYYYASGLPTGSYAIGTLEEYQQAIADLRNKPAGHHTILRNISNNVISHASDDFMSKPMRYLKNKRRSY